MSETVKVGFLGFGIVGGGAATILREHAADIEKRTGARVEIARVAVRSLSKQRAVDLDPSIVTTDPWEVVGDPSVQIVVEVIGGIEPARDLLLEAIKNGKHVVTANKELLSTLGQDVMQAADTAGVDLLFEAAVGGGIPIIRPMKESLITIYGSRTETAAVDKLISIAKTDEDSVLRRRAISRLSTSKDPRAAAALKEIVVP